MRARFCSLLLVFVLYMPPTILAQILYVDDDAPLGGNGTSWQSAYRFLQDALTDAQNSGGVITEIHVAQGVYMPDRINSLPNGSGNRSANFRLVNGVSILGGYAGINAPDPNFRNWLLHSSVLSGDLLSDDNASVPETRRENSYNILTAQYVEATTTLSGFTIQGGNANGTFQFSQGGGMHNFVGTEATISNCRFVGNSAVGDGGAVYNSTSTINFINCSFIDNHAVGNGGAIFNTSGGQIFESCDFLENKGFNGGAIYTTIGGTFLERSRFDGNIALDANGSGGLGGALFFDTVATAVTLKNVAFTRNRARGGGAIFVQGSSSPTIVNSSFANNIASVTAGALYNWGLTARVTLRNSILWGNSPQEIINESGALTTVQSSDVEGGMQGTGNINQNPLFTNASIGDLTLRTGSPAIDRGNNNYAFSLTTDLAGNPRFYNDLNTQDTGVGTPPIVDLGAYEYQPISPTLVSSSPGNAFVDPLEDRDATLGQLLGLRNFSLTFSEPITSAGGSALGTSNFQVRCVRNGATASDLQTGLVPSVTQVSGSGAGPYTLQLSQRLCLGAWAEVKAVNVVSAASGTPLSASGYDNRVVLGSLPMDITQDGRVLGDDISRWLAINSNAFNPAPLTKLLLLDQKRDGVINGPDINRAIQLLNGIGTFRAWNGFDMGPKP